MIYGGVMTYLPTGDDEMKKKRKEKNEFEGMNIPWFAIAFSAGHEQRLSPSRGGMYSGHTPPSPGRPLGVTRPTLRLKVTKLMRKREKSQPIQPAIKMPLKSFE